VLRGSFTGLFYTALFLGSFPGLWWRAYLYTPGASLPTQLPRGHSPPALRSTTTCSRAPPAGRGASARDKYDQYRTRVCSAPQVPAIQTYTGPRV
jgi:hypothetical protein